MGCKVVERKVASTLTTNLRKTAFFTVPKRDTT